MGKKGTEQVFVPESEQPYQVPGNWRWVKVKFVAEIYTGNSINEKVKTEKYMGQEKGLLFIATKDVGFDNKINYETNVKIPDFINFKVAPKNTPLLCIEGGSAGRKVGFVTQDVCFGNKLCAFVAKIVNSKYMYYILQSQCFIDQFNSKKHGLIGGVSVRDLEEIKFMIPPLAEQQRIVDRIESLFAKLDEAKEKAQAVVDGFELRKSAILHKAFTGELTERWRRENKISLDEWDNATLNDIAEYKKGPFGSSITKLMFVPKASNTYKVYEQGNAIRKTLDYGHYYITEEKYNELKSFAVRAGDIIISCAGTIGEVYKLPQECEKGVINQALMRVRLFSNIVEKFFIYYFGEILKSDVNDKANGTAIKNIPPFKIMKAMPIRLPSTTEQEVIVELLDKILRREQQAKAAASSVLTQIDTMKKSILARAFRGELGTNDPAEESMAGEIGG